MNTYKLGFMQQLIDEFEPVVIDIEKALKKADDLEPKKIGTEVIWQVNVRET